MPPPLADRFDQAWKRVLDLYFEDLLAFLARPIHAAIDWTVPPVFLDKKLNRLRPDSADGRRIADKLARVRRIDGKDTFVLILVEVQAQQDPTLPDRIVTLVLRVLEKHGLPVFPVVILADRSPRWRPRGRDFTIGGAGILVGFHSVKLLDFEPRIADLESGDSAIGRIVAAHLRALRTRPDEGRVVFKHEAIRSLFRLGLPRKQVHDLLMVLDELLTLPPQVNAELWSRIRSSEEAPMDTWLLPFEKQALETGRTEGRTEGRAETLRSILEARHGVLPERLVERLARIRTEPAFAALCAAIAEPSSLEAVERILEEWIAGAA